MTLRVRGGDRRRVDDGSRTGANDTAPRRGPARPLPVRGARAARLMSGDGGFAGPLPDHSNPQTGYLAPGSAPSSELRART